MQLIPEHRILEDLPHLIQFREVVHWIYEIGLGGAWVLDLLEAVGERLHCYGTIVEEGKVAVHPLEDARDASGIRR